MLPEQYIKYNNKKVCLADKDHFIDFDKHSGMVNTKFNRDLPMDLGGYLDKYKWLNKIKELCNIYT